MQGSAWLLVAALVFSASGLLWRALRIRSRPALPDAVRPRGSALYGAVYAFGLGMLPWNKESGRLHPAVFWIGVLMHVGIAAALATVAVRLLAGEEPPAWWLAPGGAALGLGAVAGVLLVRRVVSPSMRRLSRLDDYLAAALTAIFCAAAGLWSLGTAPAAAFDVAAAALLVYAPLGKLRHMVTFFIARFYHG